jgi:hypothetical protein
MIQFTCSCGRQLAASEEHVGQTVACPNCGKHQTVPGLTAVPPERQRPAPAAEITSASPRRSHFPEDDDAAPRRTSGMSGKAITSLILGLLSFCAPVLLSIPAIIFGFLALGDTRRGKSGSALAIIGLVAGFLSIPLALVYLVGGLFYGVQRVRDTAARIESGNKIRQMTFAIHGYQDTFKKLPGHAIYSKDGRPLLSWRVAILPFIEGGGIYDKLHLDEPWDSPHNMQFLTAMPATYADARDPESAKKGFTHYQVFVGEPGVSPRPIFVRAANDAMSLPRITASDGTSSTILIIEAADPVPWTKPEDIAYSPNTPLPRFGLGGSTFQFSTADGAVNGGWPTTGYDEANFRLGITMDDGKLFNPNP